LPEGLRFDSSAGSDLKPWKEVVSGALRTDHPATGGAGHVLLGRIAVSTAAVKGMVCGGLGAWLMWTSTLPGDGLVALMVGLFGLLWLTGAVGYFLAVFLIALRWYQGRLIGGLVDAALTAVVAWILVSIGSYPGAVVIGYSNGRPEAVPGLVWFALASLWVAGSVPILTLFVLFVTSWVRQLGHPSRVS